MLSMLAISPQALAQSDPRSEVADTLQGEGDEQQRDQAQRTITDVLNSLANGGELSPTDIDVLNGLGGARQVDAEELQRLLGDGNRGLFKQILGNPDLMNAIGNASPTGASFLEDVVAPIISEFEGGGSNGLLGAINFVIGTPTGGEYTLQGGYTYSDLLPSVFYSKKQNSDGVVNSLQVSLGELRKYPAGDADTYGQMASPDERAPDTNPGTSLAKYIAGLYEFDWLVTIDNSGKSYSPVGETFNGDATIASLGLSAGVFGAKIYDMAVRVITWLADGFKTINLPTLLGLTDTGDADNWLTSTTRKVLDSMGLTKASVAAIQFLLMVVVGGAFLLVLMASMRQPERRSYNDSRVKSLGMRVVMVVIAVPFISIFTGVINNLTEPIAKDSYNDAANINASYVVDTLNWAAVTNLSLSDAGYGSPDSEASWESYKPSSAAVGNLMDSVDARGVATGLLPEAEADRSATDLIEALRSGERADVNAYLAAIGSGQSYAFSGGLQSARTQIAAASVPRRGAVITSANHKNMVNDNTAVMIAPYFLSDRATDDKLAGGTTGGTSDTSDTSDTGAADPVTGAQDAGAHSKNTFFGADNFSGKDYECNTGAMSCAAVKWNTPDTYIYGADTPSYNSRSYRNYTGEIHDQNVQSNDPGNGEPSEDGVLEANAVSIAMMNRYAGISNVHGVPSLSTQSVAFLLQSTYDNGTLRYNGVNTAAEGALGAKNNGAHGTTFLRYTMPNTGKADLLGKISALAIVWLTSGIIAVVALFALFRAPLLIALLNMFRGLFSSMTGKISGVLVYCSYYLALRTAFMFVGAAITLGAYIATWLVNLTGIDSTIGDTANAVRGDQNSRGIVGQATDQVREAFAGAATSLATVFVCLLLCAILCWPIFTVPSHKGQVRKLSLISAIVILPFLLADMAGEWIDNIAGKVGEKPMRTTTAYAGRAQWLNQKEELGAAGKRAGHVARDAAAIGLAGATGGLTGIGGKLAKSALDKQKSDTVPLARDGKGGLVGAGSTLVGAGTAGALATVEGAGTEAAGAGSTLVGAGTEAAGAGSTLVGAGTEAAGAGTAGALATRGVGAGAGYDPVLPNGGVRAGGDAATEVLGKVGGDAGGAWEVSSDGEVIPARGAAPSAAGTAITPASAATAMSMPRGLSPEMLASMGAMLGGVVGAAGAEAVSGRSDRAEINHIDRADIDRANITGGVGGGAGPATSPADRSGAQDGQAPAPTNRERGAGADARSESVDGDRFQRAADVSKRVAGGTRDAVATAGLAAYGAFDQGSSIEKHMERLANRITGTTAQDRRLPFERERSSRLDPATLAREKKQSQGGDGSHVDAGLKRAIDQLRQQNERQARESRSMQNAMRRTETELRRNSDNIRNKPRD